MNKIVPSDVDEWVECVECVEPENEILKVKDHEDENDGDDDDDGNKAVVVGVVVSLVLLTVLIGAGVIGYKCWKKKNAELEKPDFNTTMQAENKL